MANEVIYTDAYSIYGLVNGILPKNKEEKEEKIKKYKKLNNKGVNIKKEFTEKYNSRSAQRAMDSFCRFYLSTFKTDCVLIKLTQAQ